MRAHVMRPAGLVSGALLLAVVAAGPAGARSGATSAGTSAAGAPLAASGADPLLVGRWTVAAARPRSYRLTRHSPTAIPVTDAELHGPHDGRSGTHPAAPHHPPV